MLVLYLLLLALVSAKNFPIAKISDGNFVKENFYLALYDKYSKKDDYVHFELEGMIVYLKDLKTLEFILSNYNEVFNSQWVNDDLIDSDFPC